VTTENTTFLHPNKSTRNRTYKVFLADGIYDVKMFLTAVEKWKIIPEFTVAYNGNEAARLLMDRATKQDMQDLIILDLYLPGQDGLEILKFIRNELNWQQTPVVFINSSVPPSMMETILSFPNTKVLENTSSADDFMKEIARLEPQSEH